MRAFVMTLKRAIRPLIPDALMARYRVRQHSKAMRTNVDVFVREKHRARRWLKLTPDTYRVVSADVVAGSQGTLERFGPEDAAIEAVIGWEGIDVSVRAYALEPGMSNMRIAEPEVIPESIVATDAAVREIGGVADNQTDLVRAMRRFTDTGRRIGLFPVVVDRLPRPAPSSVSGTAVVIVAAVPLHDIGGGSRAAQLAFELLDLGFHVTYVSLYPSAEGVDLGLRYIHPSLEQYRIETFDIDDIAARAESGLVIVEAPAGPFVAPVSGLKAAGWTVVYDIIDDWTDESLGGDWYLERVEKTLVSLADVVTASASDLVAHGNRLAGSREAGGGAVLVPNGVNTSVFGGPASDIPDDLPEGRLIGYHGSLYGDWFDWVALGNVAEAFPDYTIVLIGDDTDRKPTPANVTFLGLKAQRDLPAYIRRFSVGLVPFTVSDVTHAVSPLKVYEYLASGVPVAAPPLRSLEGLDGVYTDADLVQAVAVAGQAQKPNASVALADHSWNNRVQHLLTAAGVEVPALPGKPLLVVRRVPVHYDKKERWIHDA
ncbi:MAG: hypothetical protein ACR2N7_00605 [Acidimicrobiia bacterium]